MSNKFMVKVRPCDDLFNVIEVPNDTPARAIDSLHYHETKKIKYMVSIVPMPIQNFGSFSFVEIETGFEEVAGTKTVVYVDPNNEHLVQRRRTLWAGAADIFVNEALVKQ